MSPYQIAGLPAEGFAPMFSMSDEQLQAIGARRVFADADHGFPCRVSLQDAQQGEELLLLSHEHHPVASPYRAAGPIYVRRNAVQAVLAPGELSPYITRRLISVRAYDTGHWMVGAEVCAGDEVAAELERRFADDRVAYVHLHNARPGCFSCEVRRC